MLAQSASPTPLPPNAPAVVDTGYGQPSPAQGTKRLQAWEFTSAFDGGNALWCSWTRQDPPKPGSKGSQLLHDEVDCLTFHVEMARDCHGMAPGEKPKTSWFHFGVTQDPKFRGEVQFMVHGMCEQRDLFAAGYRPWVSTPAASRWTRLEGPVQVGQSKRFQWHCCWKYSFDGTPGMTRFAFCHPYGYGELMSWLGRLQRQFSLGPGRDASTGPVQQRLQLRNAEEDFLKRFDLWPDCDCHEEGEAPTSSASSSDSDADQQSGAEVQRTAGSHPAPVCAAGAVGAAGGGEELSYFECRSWHDELPRAGTDVYFHRQTVARSPRGRDVDLLTITEWTETTNATGASGGSPPLEELPQEVAEALRAAGASAAALAVPPRGFPGRPICFVSGRVHPGETPGQFACNGLLQFVLSDDPRAAELRRNFVFKVVPMLNPDGVAWGHYRTNTLGFDLNRCYRDPSPAHHEGVFAVKTLLLAWASRGELLCYLDCHGHSARRGCFLFGNHHGSQAWSSEDALLYNLAYVHAVQLNCPHFDIDACEWSRATEAKKGREQEEEVDETSRSDSGRAQIGASCRLYHAYTLECNYHISRTVRPCPDPPGLHPGAYAAQALRPEAYSGDPGRPGQPKRPKPLPYGPQEWAAVGEALAVALLDLHCLSPCSRLAVAAPPRPLLPPDKDLTRASLGLERLFSALSQRHQAATEPRVPSDLALGLGPTPKVRRRIFRVVHSPHVYIRDRPLKTASSLGIRKTGDTVLALEVRSDGWIQLDPSEHKKIARKNCSEAYMLVDGTAVGLGVLLSDTHELECLPLADFCQGGVLAQAAASIEDVEAGRYPLARGIQA